MFSLQVCVNPMRMVSKDCTFAFPFFPSVPHIAASCEMAVEDFFLDRWVKQLGVRPSQTLLTYYSNVGVAEGSYTYAEFDGRTALLAATLRGKWSVATQERWDQGVVSFSGVRDVAW